MSDLPSVRWTELSFECLQQSLTLLEATAFPHYVSCSVDEQFRLSSAGNKSFNMPANSFWVVGDFGGIVELAKFPHLKELSVGAHYF